MEELHSRDDRAERERRPAVVVGVSTAAASVLVGSEDVTESARAYTYYSTEPVQKTCEFRLLTVLAVNG